MKPPPPLLELFEPIKAVLSLQGDGHELLVEPLSEWTSDDEPPSILLLEDDLDSNFLPRGRGELSGVFNISGKREINNSIFDRLKYCQWNEGGGGG